MFLDRPTDDNRIELRDHIRRELDHFLRQYLRPGIPPRIVLGALVSAAKQLHLRIGDPIHPRGRGRPRAAP